MDETINPQTLIYEALKNDPLLWGRHFFPHHFKLRSPVFHYEMLDASKVSTHLAVASPRESSKSTLLVFIYPFHCIVFKKRRFILIVSNTFKKAAMHLESIKKEIRENEALKASFPGIEILKDAEGDSDIRHAGGFTTKVLCKGVDQIGSVRGVKFGHSRPNLIIVDDCEDDELVKNPVRRLELQQQFDEALVPAGEKGVCQYIVVGTVLHDDCLLAKLVNKDHYPEYRKLFFRARLDNGESLWPEKWSKEYLLELEKSKPTVFAKEYQNDPVAAGNVRFKREDFRYWKMEGGDYILLDFQGQPVSRGSLKDCRAAIACDLAWKENREADSSVLMPGFLTPQAEILIETYVNEKGLRPDKLAEHLFMMVDRLEKLTGSVVTVGFEKAMLENVTQWLLKKEMDRRGKHLLTKDLVWDTDKNTRIETRLQPGYCQHVIYHKQGMGDLEYQLERFPYGAHEDLPDAEQGLVQLLQYPKTGKQNMSTDDEFERIRKIAIDFKNGKPYGMVKTYGNKIPAYRSFR